MFRVRDDEGNDITDDCLRGIRAEWHMRELGAAERAAELAALREARGEERGIYAGRGATRELVARPLAHIPPEVYYHWVQREGRECWADRGFLNDMLRDNPELRANVTKDMSRVSFAGARHASGEAGGGAPGLEIYLPVSGAKRETVRFAEKPKGEAVAV